MISISASIQLLATSIHRSSTKSQRKPSHIWHILIVKFNFSCAKLRQSQRTSLLEDCQVQKLCQSPYHHIAAHTMYRRMQVHTIAINSCS